MSDRESSMGFEAAVARYLDGAMGDAEFELLQSQLRASGENRRRFLDLCRQAQECSEVVDSRLIAAASQGESRAGQVIEAEFSPVRTRIIKVAAIAAAVALCIGLWISRPRVSGELVERPDVSGATEEAAELDGSRLIAPVSLLELAPEGFVLTYHVAPVWEDVTPDVAAAIEPPAGWLDGVGLLVVDRPAAHGSPDDIRL